MKREHIYDNDWRYTILRIIWTDWAISHSYRQYKVCGKENIPEDGAIILCPNHCNTLMDALVVLGSHKDKMVFGARADLFRKPFIARLMSFVRILPMVRQRDGLRNVLQNNQTQDIIVDILEHDTRFCLFPEGTHRTRHSLQKLGKGAFRIALAANAKFGDKKPVYLVPVGLEYGDYFRYRSTCLINYGPAINVTRFLEEGNFEGDPQAIEALRTELSERIDDLITYIPDDENYDSKWELTKMAAIYKCRKGYGQFGTRLDKSMLKNRKIAAGIEVAMAEKPDKMRELLERVGKFEKERRESGISIYSFRKMNPVANMFGKGLAALLGLPYFIFSAVTSLPVWAIALIIRSNVKDPAFRNTVSFAAKLSIGYIMLIVYTVLAFCLAPWWMAMIFMALYLPAYSYFHDYIEGCRRWISDIRLYRRKGLYKEFKHIVKDFLHITK
jgi:1-acyl-sn-glycerol-3-phosphate acyltransferase